MTIEIKVPTLGESVTEATVAKWLKQPGDVIERDEPVVELETDKVTLEVPAPAAGTLGEIRAAMPPDTILLVTSDHPLRDWIVEDAGWWNDRETASLGSIPRRYVPLLVRSPLQPPSENHENVSVHDLVLSLFTHIML